MDTNKYKKQMRIIFRLFIIFMLVLFVTAAILGREGDKQNNAIASRIIAGEKLSSNEALHVAKNCELFEKKTGKKLEFQAKVVDR